MRLLKMIVVSKNRVAVLKVACAAILFINVYLLMQFFSWDHAVGLRVNRGGTATVKPTVVHPFAHLLPSQGQLTSVKKCVQPKLSLLHDTLSFAFYPMKPLNCSGSNFFHLRNGFLIANKTMKDKLKMCAVFAIKRESDNYSFLEKLTDTSGNTSVKIHDDFLYVRCLLRDDSELDTEQDGEMNLNYNRSTVKVNIPSAVSVDIKNKPLLFEEANPTTNTENRINSKLAKRSLKSESHRKINGENIFPNVFRVRRDVDKNIKTPHQNSEQETSYSKKYKATDSNRSSIGREQIEKSLYTSNGSSLSGHENKKHSNVNVDKELDRVQGSALKTVENRIVRNFASTMKQQDGDNHRMEGQIKAGLKKNSKIKLENNEKSLSTDEDEYGDFEYNNPTESEQNEMDESYDGMNRYPGELQDNWAMDDYPQQLEEMDVDTPACGEEQILVQVSPLKHVFERYRATKSEQKSDLNVLMLGIDSMSNMAFRRKLPLTLKYLQAELGALIFEGYNIVGDGTTQALLPMFLGKLQQEVPGISDAHLDNLDFVWKHYRKQGYVTMFAEDEPHLGVFNLRLPGFQDEPTDHYMRHFWQAQAGLHLKSTCSSQYCTGSTPSHQYLLHYLHGFFQNYPGIPHFAVGYSGELSHNEVNPSEYLDNDLRKFLVSLKTGGYLNNTVVVIFADHGSRKGKLRRLLQGKIEERLPFFSMVFPESFRKMHKTLFGNLRMNTRRLITPFDVHETLHNLLDLSKVYSSDKPESKRGISLLQPIAEDRTCSQAGIDTHWCTCVQEKPVPTSEPVVKEAAQAVIDVINNLTRSDRSQCAALKLCTIHSASIVVPNMQVLKFHKSEENTNFTASYGNATLDMIELQVTIETDQCRGVFEATVQVHYSQNDTLTPDMAKLTFHVFEQDISRINTYGSQSACINKRNPHIMKFCCCKSYLHREKPGSC